MKPGATERLAALRVETVEAIRVGNPDLVYCLRPSGMSTRHTALQVTPLRWMDLRWLVGDPRRVLARCGLFAVVGPSGRATKRSAGLPGSAAVGSSGYSSSVLVGSASSTPGFDCPAPSRRDYVAPRTRTEATEFAGSRVIGLTDSHTPTVQ